MNSILKPEDFAVVFPDKESVRTMRTVLLLGGAASVKSSVLGEAAKTLAASGAQPEVFTCARNPELTVAVRAPSRKIVLADGNYFNKITMFYPSAAEKIFSLDACTDAAFLQTHKTSLLHNFDKSDLFSARARKYQNAARAVKGESAALVQNQADKAKIANYIIRFLTRYKLSAEEHPTVPTVRRLSAISMWGVHTDCTAFEPLETVFVLHDEVGTISAMLIHTLCYAVTGCAEAATLFKCALTDQCEHLILPSLRVGFFTENKNHPYPFANARRVHMKRFLRTVTQQANREKLLFNSRLLEELLDETVFSVFESEHCLRENDTLMEKALLPNAYTELCRQVAALCR